MQIETVEKAGFVAGVKIDVKYLGKNDKGQMRLSRRAALLRDSTPSATGYASSVPSKSEDASVSNAVESAAAP